MNASTILNNEQKNNGRLAHCYYEPEVGTWIAYGRSAYALRLMVKSAGRDNLRSYSKEMNTVCSMTGNITIMELCNNNFVLSMHI